MQKIVIISNLDILEELELLNYEIERRKFNYNLSSMQIAESLPKADIYLVDCCLGNKLNIENSLNVSRETILIKSKKLCNTIKMHIDNSKIVLYIKHLDAEFLQSTWQIDDFITDKTDILEIKVRLQLLLSQGLRESDETIINAKGLQIDASAYLAKVNGKPLDLTYKEFELLKFLAVNAGHVFSRQQLLSEVWGYDYYGGARTVDVHIRRLRFKLGAKESLIETIRGVGYKFNTNKNESI